MFSPSEPKAENPLSIKKEPVDEPKELNFQQKAPILNKDNTRMDNDLRK